MRDCYSIEKEDFVRLRPKIKFEIVKTVEDTYDRFARALADLIKENNSRGKMTCVILPVGPVDFRRFAMLCNKEKITCRNLVTINMDEYCDDNGNVIPYEHPLSFHRFMDENFFSLLDEDKKVLKNNRIFPDPEKPHLVQKKIDECGGIDVTYGGVGITGHLAFNDPPEPGENVNENDVKDSVTRIITPSRETKTGIAIGGTGGDWSIIPPKAVTVGMREILGAREIHLFGIRTWHAGTFRRALFGPVNVDCPASYVQLHPNVKVTMASHVAELPMPNVTLNIGK